MQDENMCNLNSHHSMAGYMSGNTKFSTILATISVIRSALYWLMYANTACQWGIRSWHWPLGASLLWVAQWEPHTCLTLLCVCSLTAIASLQHNRKQDRAFCSPQTKDNSETKFNSNLICVYSFNRKYIYFLTYAISKLRD